MMFNNRKNGKNHHIKDVKRSLFRQLKKEEYQANLSQKQIQFTEVWGPVYDELYNKFAEKKNIYLYTCTCQM